MKSARKENCVLPSIYINRDLHIELCISVCVSDFDWSIDVQRHKTGAMHISPVSGCKKCSIMLIN